MRKNARPPFAKATEGRRGTPALPARQVRRERRAEDIKLITRNTDYVIRALCFIAKSKKQTVTIAELVKQLKMPRPFLRKILQALGRNGMLNSYRGLNGGFRLAVSAKDIYLKDIMNIFQGPLMLNECLFKKRPCPNKGGCLLRKRIGLIEKYVVSQLEPVTIASLLG